MKLWVCFPIPAILCLFLSREEIARPCDQIIKAGYHIVEGEKKVWNINSWRHTYWQSCKRRSSAASAHASLRRPHWNVHNPRTCNFPQRATTKKKKEESMRDSGNWWEGNASGAKAAGGRNEGAELHRFHQRGEAKPARLIFKCIRSQDS